MRNIYIMIVVTIVFFVVSMDFLIKTSVFIDILLVIAYLILVARTALKLETDVKEVDNEYVLREKKTAFFAPLIFIYFLSFSISVGLILIIINALVVVLLYVYIYVSITKNKIIVSNESVTTKYLNGKSMTMKWVDIVKVDFSWVYNLIIFIDSEGNQLKLDISLQDFLLIINMMKERLLKDDYQNAFKKLRQYNDVFLMNSNNIHLQ